MTNDAMVKNLVKFGLGEKEAKAYLALLHLELATATQVAEYANLNRSSTYVVLESLKEKGLVSISEDNNIQHYIAASPDILLFEAHHKAQQAQDIKNNIGDIIPELKALHKDTKQKPKVKVFEGKQGLMSVLENTLSSREKILRIASPLQNLAEALPEYFTDYTKRRIKLGITMHGIHPKDKETHHATETKSKLNKSIFISPKKYAFLADMMLYDNKVVYVSLEKSGVSIMIESKEISDVNKNIFDLAYKEAKRLNNINALVVTYKESLKRYTRKNSSLRDTTT